MQIFLYIFQLFKKITAQKCDKKGSEIASGDNIRDLTFERQKCGDI